ncbi:PREDICTED: uncharacterized protein LOC108568380 [Nicrophorus vespilloides]|uniref:Uncharacterized protein LOC108568380 n=1 Tax=Nicrophorus vespilloides TaxID=110193 RepID=A0ABM1NDN1_NICVS|nr:PREDICTED: uncharacterized protein LOC108568380 [Nicrophorus vespilloides]
MFFYAVPEESCRCSTVRILKNFTQELVLSKKPAMKGKKLSEYVKKLLDLSTKQHDSKKLNDSMYLDKEEMKRLIRANFEMDLNKKKPDKINHKEAVASTPTKSKQNVAEFFENFEPQSAIKKKPVKKINLENDSSINSYSENNSENSPQFHNETKSLFPWEEFSEVFKKFPGVTPRPHLDLKAIRERVELQLKMEFKEQDEQFERITKRHFDELDIERATSFIKRYSSIKDDSGIINRSFLVCSKLQNQNSGNVSNFTENISTNQSNYCYCIDCANEDSGMLKDEDEESKKRELFKRNNISSSAEVHKSNTPKKDDSGNFSFSHIDLPKTKILEVETFEFTEKLNLNETPLKDDSGKSIFSNIDIPETNILEVETFEYSEEYEKFDKSIEIEQDQYEMEKELNDSEESTILMEFDGSRREEEIYYPRLTYLETIFEESFESVRSVKNRFEPASQSQDSASDDLSTSNEEEQINSIKEISQTSSIFHIVDETKSLFPWEDFSEVFKKYPGITPRPHLDLNSIRKKVEKQLKVEFKKEDELFEIIKNRYFEEKDIERANSFIKKYSFMKDDSGIINRKNLVCTKFKIEDSGYVSNLSDNQSLTEEDSCFCIDCTNQHSKMLSNNILKCTNLENQICKYLKESYIDINELKRRVNIKLKMLREQDEEFRIKESSNISETMENDDSGITSFSHIDHQQTTPENQTMDNTEVDENLRQIEAENDNYADSDSEDSLNYCDESDFNEECTRYEEYYPRRRFLETIFEESFESECLNDDWEEELCDDEVSQIVETLNEEEFVSNGQSRREDEHYQRMKNSENFDSESSLFDSLEYVIQSQEDNAINESSNVTNHEVIDSTIHLETEDDSQFSTQPKSLFPWEEFSEVFKKFPEITPRSHLDLNVIRKRVEIQLELEFKKEGELLERIKKKHLEITRANTFIKKYFFIKDKSGTIDRRISSFTQIDPIKSEHHSNKVEFDLNGKCRRAEEYFQVTNILKPKIESRSESETSFYDSLEAINESQKNCNNTESSKNERKTTKLLRDC